jgi:hypothetical protein
VPKSTLLAAQCTDERVNRVLFAAAQREAAAPLEPGAIIVARPAFVPTRPMTHERLAGVIPACNEAATIRSVAQGALRRATRLIVADGGSTDGTTPCFCAARCAVRDARPSRR